jgi:hypothetical protein
MSSTKLTAADIESEFDRALQHHQKSRNIERKNWELYSGFDYGQWPEKAKQDLKRANRHVIQLNYIRGKINTLAGSIAKNGLEIDFVPVNTDCVEVTKVLKGLFYSDRDMFDWDNEYLEVVKDGLVHRGVEEMYVSEKFSPLGNVGFRRLEPGHLILDPDWKSHDAKELVRAWKVAYLTPKQIKEIYKKSSDKVDAMIALKATQISDFEDDTSTESMNKFNLEDLYGDIYRVVEYHHVRETQKKTKVYAGADNIEDVTDYDEAALAEFIEANSQDNPGEVIEKTKTIKEYWVTTTCNQLFGQNDILEDAKSEIQIERLPFFPWSAARINGRDSGMVSLLADAQETINKRESLSDHMISSSAHGSMFVDSALFNGNQAQTKEALKELDKPNARIVTAPGVLASGRNYFYQTPKTPYAGELYQEIDRMRGALESISGVTATMEGGKESSHDTGVLFARRQMQAEIALTTVVRGLEQHWNDKGEAYIMVAKELYSGAYRKFKTDYGVTGDDKEIIELNGGAYTLEDIPRHKVIVSQSPRGVTLREVEREVNSEVLQRIPPEQTLYKAMVTRNIMNTLDLTGDEKKMLEIANEVEVEKALKMAQLEIKGMDLQIMQIDMQTQQMQQPPQPQVPEEGQPIQPGQEQQA